MSVQPTTIPYLSRQERASISLEELQTTASYLIRRDRKYLLSVRTLASVLDAVDENARVLEINNQRTFAYESLYFDTEDFQSYYRSLRQRPDRFKVRVRIYKDSELSYLEAKTHDHHGRTVKQRRDRNGVMDPKLSSAEHAWLGDMREIDGLAANLTHMMTTRYVRATLALPNGEGRVTIDHHLEFSMNNGHTIALPSIVILESKGAGRPTSIDRMLWRHGIRPVSISKFGCGMSLLAEELPSNHWHRVCNTMKGRAVRDQRNIREVQVAIERI